MTHILIVNDDGYLSPGLVALVDNLRPYAKLTIVAPEKNCSGSSNALTLSRPLSVNYVQDNSLRNGFIYIDGTPTDCIYIALAKILKKKPDLIISGINNGENLGEDIFYSGTVGAAIEGVISGIPAIAFSQIERNWDHLLIDIAKIARDIVLKKIQDLDCLKQAPVLFNVNIPNLSYQFLKNREKITRLGKRNHIHSVITQKNPRGGSVFWIDKPSQEILDNASDTDFYAIQEKYISLTLIRPNYLFRNEG